MEKTFYIEFNINGVIKVLESNKKQALKQLNFLISKIIEENNLELVRADHSVDVVSEEEIIHAMTNYDPEHYD